jgi:hypothetical protein
MTNNENERKKIFIFTAKWIRPLRSGIKIGTPRRLRHDIFGNFRKRGWKPLGPDVCLLYDLTMSGKTIFGCGWYEVRQGKVVHLRVVFDPRPFLEGKK